VLALVPGSVPLVRGAVRPGALSYAVVGEISADGRLLVTDPCWPSRRSTCPWMYCSAKPRA